jgi:hypothetical protein
LRGGNGHGDTYSARDADCSPARFRKGARGRPGARHRGGNDAQVPVDVLDKAERIAGDAYALAGVSVVWLERTRATSQVRPDDIHVVVVLLSGEMSARKAAEGRLALDVLGTASSGVGRAYVLTSRVMAVANQMATSPVPAVLGHVMAHEVGHLLLPPNSHTATGIMAENIEIGMHDPQRFEYRQERLLRLKLASRD